MRAVADHQPNSPTPPKYEAVVTVTLGLYPLVVVGNLWVAPRLEFLPLLVRLFVTTVMNVTVLTYVVMPLVTGKSYRRMLKALAARGPEGVTILLQGTLKPGPGGRPVLEGAGISAVPRSPAAPAEGGGA